MRDRSKRLGPREINFRVTDDTRDVWSSSKVCGCAFDRRFFTKKSLLLRVSITLKTALINDFFEGSFGFIDNQFGDIYINT